MTGKFLFANIESIPGNVSIFKLNSFKRKNKKPSIRDVAKEAKVSVGTVSSVINKSRFVHKEKEAKVLKAIRKLNYRPNSIARSLRTKSTRTIGVIIPNIGDPFFSQVLTGMERIARKRKYTMILGCSFYDIQEEKRQIDILVDQLIDGVIIISGYDNYDFIKKIYDTKLPIVSREIKCYPEIPSIVTDSYLAMLKGVEFLKSFGHKKIGYVTIPYKNETVPRDRYKGFRDGLKKYGLEYNPEYVIIDESIRLNEEKGTRNIVEKRFKGKDLPTAFLTFSDVCAVGLMKGLKNLGYKIPDDISVMGFNNIDLCEFVEPTLTTISIPKRKLGEKFVNLLIDIIEGKQLKETTLEMPTKIIKRESVNFNN